VLTVCGFHFGISLGVYTERLGVQAVAQRLGYLLELFELGSAPLVESLQALTATGYVRLNPLLPKEGPYLRVGGCASISSRQL
jgi:predicted transcriptional regulator of viral defense system